MAERNSESDPILPKKEDNSHRRHLIGNVFSFCCCLANVIANTTFQRLRFTRKISEFEVMGLRFAIILTLVCIPRLVHKKKLPNIERMYWITQILSCSCGFFYWSLQYFAAEFIPLGELRSIQVGFNLVFASVLAKFVLKQHVTKCVIVSCVVIIGLLLTVQPRVVFTNAVDTWLHLDNSTSDNSNNSQLNNTLPLGLNNSHNWDNVTVETAANSISQNITEISSNDTDIQESTVMHTEYIGYILIALSGSFQSGYIFSSSLLLKVIDFEVVLFWITVFNTLIPTIMMPIFGNVSLPHDKMETIYFLSNITSYVASLLFRQAALKYTSPTMNSIIESSTVPLMFLSQYTVNKDIMPGSGNWMELLGGAIIFSVSLGTAVYDVFKTM